MQNDTLPLYPQMPSHSIQKNMNVKDNSNNMVAVTSGVAAVPQRPLLGPENTVTMCPFCQASIKTAVKYTTTTRTHITAALCCFICCLCCIPYCSESAKNADHYCPNCQKYIGTYEK